MVFYERLPLATLAWLLFTSLFDPGGVASAERPASQAAHEEASPELMQEQTVPTPTSLIQSAQAALLQLEAQAEDGQPAKMDYYPKTQDDSKSIAWDKQEHRAYWDSFDAKDDATRLGYSRLHQQYHTIENEANRLAHEVPKLLEKGQAALDNSKDYVQFIPKFFKGVETVRPQVGKTRRSAKALSEKDADDIDVILDGGEPQGIVRTPEEFKLNWNREPPPQPLSGHFSGSSLQGGYDIAGRMRMLESRLASIESGVNALHYQAGFHAGSNISRPCNH